MNESITSPSWFMMLTYFESTAKKALYVITRYAPIVSSSSYRGKETRKVFVSLSPSFSRIDAKFLSIQYPNFCAAFYRRVRSTVAFMPAWKQVLTWQRKPTESDADFLLEPENGVFAEVFKTMFSCSDSLTSAQKKLWICTDAIFV